ncbi:hypothetical protein Patl_1724 [Paraglaciecola sp. T6c]|uniref:CsiV family protein n=1 Tax=Pseudoalteromonas atlantica (strain T6c / ATCC BAA-1087) TaxID=3042615 RepID=UPI00005C594F|nr:CsiV family protein [Paraglaciecola sp. T6c]ABG40245.1 hypothetical protein Patl_1724 [Paraglaciecola sp. T6c]
MPNMFSFVNTKNQSTTARKPKLGMTLLALSCTLGLHNTAHANDWWFDVEVIVFKRDIAAQSIAESFAHKAPEFASPTAFDLLSDYITPDLTYMSAGLPSCDASVEVNQKEQHERQFILANTVFTETDYSYLDVQDEPAADETTALIDQLRGAQSSSVANNPTSTIDTRVYTGSDNVSQSGAQVTPSTSPTLSEPTWVKWQIPQSLPCAFEQDRVLLAGPYDKPIDVSQPERIPRNIDGVEWPNRQSPYLLPKSAQQLEKLEEHIRWQKDLTPILHLTWRQPVVFGKDNAQPFRLIAGENYAQAYDQDGQRKVESPQVEPTDPRFSALEDDDASSEQGLSNQALFAQINAALASPEPAKVIDFSQGTPADASIDAEDFIQVAEKPLWQLEGDFKVYLENLGRTPYLHIDSNLDYRAPITLRLPGDTDVQPNNFLQSFHFDQLRRVISKQLHYFDHPLFGMVVQIRRYEPPKETDID